jgi:predicted nucleotidyltransferase
MIDQLKPLIEQLKQIDTVDKVYLFGSQAKGTATEESDYDIALISENDDVLSIVNVASERLWGFYSASPEFHPSVEFHVMSVEELESTPLGQEIVETGLLM